MILNYLKVNKKNYGEGEFSFQIILSIKNYSRKQVGTQFISLYWTDQNSINILIAQQFAHSLKLIFLTLYVCEYIYIYISDLHKIVINVSLLI